MFESEIKGKLETTSSVNISSSGCCCCWSRREVLDADSVVDLKGRGVCNISYLHNSFIRRQKIKFRVHFHKSEGKKWSNKNKGIGVYIISSIYTVYPRSSCPFYLVSYCIKWATTSWTDCTFHMVGCSIFLYNFS